MSECPGSGSLLSGIRRFLLLSALLAACAGCHWGKPASPPYAPPPQTSAPETSRDIEAAGGPTVGTAAQAPAEASAPPAEEKAAASAPGSAPQVAAPPEPAQPPAGPPVEEAGKPAPSAAAPSNGRKPSAAVSFDEPAWARGKEELVFRVEFLGMTMGYARFTFKGKVLWNGKETYHLSVRAWTSDFLSVIYPINETIDYYMDVKTLEPLRQEFTGREKKKDDVAFYDQKKGRIVYRYKHSGEIRKEVDVIPSVFDPVTVAYYFRARDLGDEGRPRNVYGGRKLYQISSRLLGREKIETTRGPVETVVIQPVIKRDGQLDNKGDLKVWMTNDSRHVPVRIYAKFKKIKMWTLFAELVPPKEGG
ncbi:MAG: DUF3108 domain-containing protein [Deltaproteobacteria bacterium]|nr:DUF3108 domain-containing protein [Deltaproteobacteria bacterium]